MSDGSTDSGILEQEKVYTRFAKEGAINVRFVSVEHVERGTVINIHKALGEAMSSVAPDWQEKLVAFGSDGASVMQGKKGGVVALLRLNTPWLQVLISSYFLKFHDVFVFISRH